MNYSTILKQVQTFRMSTNRADAAHANAFFMKDLTHPDARGAFKYPKGGKQHLMTSDEHIGGAWRKLLKAHDDIRESFHSGLSVTGAPLLYESLGTA